MSEIKHKDKIITIISMFFPDAKIYLFGSYARGEERIDSDIDIAIDNGEPVRIVTVQQIKNMIDALNLVQKTDVVDFRRAPLALQKNILRDGVTWKD